MKKLLITAMTALAILGAGCTSTQITETAEAIEIPETAITRTFEVQDMTCVSCAFGVEAAIEEIEGVYAASVDYQTTSGSVSYDTELVAEEAIVEAALPYILTF
jgi:copper chaperone CopZ